MSREAPTTFEGIGSYPAEKANMLLETIRNLSVTEQTRVRLHMELGPHIISEHPPLDSSNNKIDATAVVRFASCMLLASEAAQALGIVLANHHAAELAIKARSKYTNVPSVVYQFLSPTY